MAALHMLCHQQQPVSAPPTGFRTIVVGFVGGFANPRDVKHPEILFATYLREHYGPMLDAHVFSNHDRNGALHYVMGLLDTDHDGVVSDAEKSSARVIIYGHSWGASETVAFARALQHYSIPVLLTVQLDTVGKWGQRPSRVPSNVETAVNFFQSEGFLRGRPVISAEDETHTEIAGNFQYSYVGKPIDCSNYPWLARTFNKPHHEIENDPDVWNRIAFLIDSRVKRTSPDKEVTVSQAASISQSASSASRNPGQ
jgi:hypothetical protein